MSMYDDCKDNLSRAVTTSTKPCLDEISETTNSANKNYNEYDPDLESCRTSDLLKSRCYGSEVSKKLTYEILKRYNQLDPLFMFDNDDDITKNNVEERRISQKSVQVDLKEKRSDRSFPESSIHRRKSMGVQYEVASEIEVRSYHYSRSNSVCNVEFPKRFTSGETHLSVNKSGLLNIKEKKRVEKMNYCLPVTNNFYNEELIYRTVERNRRLRKLVKEMTVARENEKQVNAWNNYINELRHKHRHNDATRKIGMPYMIPENSAPEVIEDFYKTKFKCQQSNNCKTMLKDFYEPCTSTQTNCYDHLDSECYGSVNFIGKNELPIKRSESYTLTSDPKIILKRDRSNQCETIYNSQHIAEHDNCDKTILIQKYSNEGNNSQQNTKCTVVRLQKRKSPRLLKSSSIQTNLKLLPLKKQSKENVTNNYNKVAENILNIKNSVDINHKLTENSFKSIESKLDVLINSVNTLITEIRNSVSRNSSLSNNNRMSISRSVDAVRMPNTKAFNERLGYSTSKLPLVYNCSPETSKIDKIIVEEMNKSDEVKRDIENILNGEIKKSCAVQIINDFIPTKDRSTEVTISLSEAKVKGAEEIHRNFSKDPRMTIAINTDPLGLQALLRISKETVKNVLSFMQNFSYQNLLQLPLPLLRESYATTPFVCSVCGAVFMTTSQLTDHIHSHVRNRYCCVCRHLTGAATENQNPRRLFTCEFCSKPFSRAYCCELHQQTCAKRLGRLRDVTSSLVLLK